MEAEQEIGIFLIRKPGSGLYGHVGIRLMGQIDHHVFIRFQFFLHGPCRGHGHLFLHKSVILSAQIFSPMSGIDHNDQRLFFG